MIRKLGFVVFYLLAFYLLAIFFGVWPDKSRGRYLWSLVLAKILNVTIVRLRNSTPLQYGNTVMLFNHTSHADFFIDDLITQGTCNFLSRLLVGIVMFPFLLVRRVVWFFAKGKKTRNQMFQWMDYMMANSPRWDLLAYPQGHRYTDIKQGRQLRTGMIQWAYERGREIQWCLVYGRDRVISEKRMHISYGQSVTYWSSKPISPVGKSLSSFTKEVTEIFDNEMDKKWQDDKRWRDGDITIGQTVLEHVYHHPSQKYI